MKYNDLNNASEFLDVVKWKNPLPAIYVKVIYYLDNETEEISQVLAVLISEKQCPCKAFKELPLPANRLGCTAVSTSHK